jgi:hypothetical protein
LNKSPSVNLLGDADGAAGAVAAGEAAVVASAFLCARRFPGDGDAAGDSAVEGDADASAGEAVAGLAAAGLADAEVFGLNKLRSVNLLGDAEGPGLAATSVFGAGLAATSVFAFL